jgi:hypothetical protein
MTTVGCTDPIARLVPGTTPPGTACALSFAAGMRRASRARAGGHA